MSVVVGASLVDSLLLVADSRATLSTGVRVDNLQKVFPLPPNGAIGFAGDVEPAGVLLQELLAKRALRQPPPRHPLHLVDRLRRFLAARYPRLPNHPITGKRPAIQFVYAAMTPLLPQMVHRARAVALLDRWRLGTLSADRQWCPDGLVQLVMGSSETFWQRLINVPMGILCVLKSPKFVPEFEYRLGHVTIGSGQAVCSEIDDMADAVFAGEMGNGAMEAIALRNCVEKFFQRSNIPSVGGLLPTIRLSAQGRQYMGSGLTIPSNGTQITMNANSFGRWIQKNEKTGKTMPLLPPWEAAYGVSDREAMFNDLDDAMREFRSRQTTFK